MADIDSAPISAMAEASYDDLLEEIRTKRATATIAPWVLGLGAFALYLLGTAGVSELPLVAAVVVVGVVWWWASARDAVRRTVVIGYALDEQAAARFEALLDAFKALSGAGHPGAAPTPSSVDRQTMERIARDPGAQCREPVLLIVGGDPKEAWFASAQVFPAGGRTEELRRALAP